MTNAIFMKPGGLVVEVVGYWDGRMLPVCGYTGVLCAASGHHHFIYYYDFEGRNRDVSYDKTNEIIKKMNIGQLVTQTKQFYARINSL